MANTLLEYTRGLHEDNERLERIIVKDFKQETKTHKEKLMQQHRVRKRLDQMQENAKKLIKVYDDDDEARKDEIAALGGSATNVFSKFYDRLKEIKDYHKRYPNRDVTEAEDDTEMLKEEPAIEFTGEEAMGRFLDLLEPFGKFINAKFGKHIDYFQYIASFSDFSDLPKHLKFTEEYREYVQSLLSYLEGYYERTQPLALLAKQMKKFEADFQQRWEAGMVPGWEDRGRNPVGPSGKTTGDLEALNLDAFDSVEELQELGADRLKEALMARGLKTGGTVMERATRLFAVKGRALEELDRKLFAKGAAPVAARTPEQLVKQEEAGRRAGLLEYKVQRMAELLVNVISDTKGRVEKKMSQTYEEMQAEMEEAEAEYVEEEEEDENEYIYNPLKLPLGWDGKPIPYWLYKLHGLNQEFKCEICGNQSYWGRRAFEKHFKEYRHQTGMRALGIPNNKMFYEVTTIQDAEQLNVAIMDRNRGRWNPEVDEEFEDVKGNVYNKKTYMDLQKQGLL